MVKKVFKWVGIAFLAFVALGIIAVATDDKKSAGKSELNVESVSYEVADQKVTGNQMDYHLLLPDRVSDKTILIEITRKLREENKWKGKFVCWFEIQIHAQSGAWANCGYLPECETCATDKDADGVPVQCMIIGMSRGRADSLKSLTLDTIANKELVGGYIDDSWQCKSEIYRVKGKPNKLLVGKLYGKGSRMTEWMTLKTINDEKRYYLDDSDDTDQGYMQLDESNRTVRFLLPSGTVRQASIFL